jgi:hypothetical protein
MRSGHIFYLATSGSINTMLLSQFIKPSHKHDIILVAMQFVCIAISVSIILYSRTNKSLANDQTFQYTIPIPDSHLQIINFLSGNGNAAQQNTNQDLKFLHP